MPLWGYILIVIIVILVGWMTYSRTKKKASPNQKDIELKAQHLDQIFSYLNRNDEIDNARVQSMLGVSPATAGRYLEELQQQGKIVQIGQGVIYKKS